ncbi:DUF7522 family protein [Halobacterium zhouii]|uniref:DUF7522 family protein n=1 Tax=Halobacterium zhouii TaxID=2902624 RepID=UPI001E4B542B|nr:hypothetical protein [Halobacterium zhouii]
MNDQNVSDLVEHLHETVGDDLRSVIRYDFDAEGYDVVYARDDILDDYSEETVENIVRTYETDALSKTGQEKWYNHGEQQCIMRCFENGVEVNLLADGQGVAVGLDKAVFAAQKSFIGDCMELAGVTSE